MKTVTVLAVAATAVNAFPIDFKFPQNLQHVFSNFNNQDNTDISSSITSHVNVKNLETRAQDLYEIAQKSLPEYGNPTRVIGSKGHRGTLNYIISSLTDFGAEYFDVWTQRLSATAGKVNSFKLEVSNEPVKSIPFSLTPPTPEKEPVTSSVSFAKNNGCDLKDFDDIKNGSIVLIQRGECPFGQKSENAGKSGAVACLIYNNEGKDENISGTLGTPSDDHVPTLGLSKSNGDKYIEMIKKNNKIVEATVCLDSIVTISETYNLLAETKQGDHDNVVMLGAHSDSVTEGPGINDDGSGTISLLEAARVLTSYNVTNAVRFAWWSAEEEGLVGSDYYAQSLSTKENLKIRVFMDYDMMASPNYAYQIYDANNQDNPNGSGNLKDMYTRFYEEIGQNYTFTPFDGRSDYDGFIRHGIPAGGVATGAEELKTEKEVEMFGGKAGIAYDPCYHQLCDNLDNLDYDAWVINTKLIAHSCALYGTSLEGFPKRELKTFDLPEKAYKEYNKPELVM